MYVDVSNIVNAKGLSMDVNLTETMEALHTQSGEVSFTEPVKVKGTLSNIEGILSFQGTLDAALELRCDRCTKPIEKAFSLSVEENFSNSKDVDPEKEIQTFVGSRIDLTPVIISMILLHLPMKFVCSAECKGFCPSCGQNLDEAECNCDHIDIDPRFEKLKSLFKDQ